MVLRVLFFCVLFKIGPHQLCGGNKYFTFTDNCHKAQKMIFELKLDDADKTLKTEAEKFPNNAVVDWLSETVIFMRIFTSEDAVLYKQNSKSWDELINRVEKNEFKSAWYRYILSDMYIHRTLIKLKFGENISAGSDVKSAFKHLKENKKTYPDFLPDNKNQGFLSCLFSTVPSKYQWLTKLIGFQGDMDDGLAEIKKYLNSTQHGNEHKLLKLEAAFMYSMVQHHLNKNTAEAWKTIEPYTLDFKTYIIENYMRATIAGYAGKTDLMIEVLSAKPPHTHSSPFYYMDYLLGLAKLRRLDSDADLYFKIFTVRYKGNNYLKSAYRYLSWSCQLKGDNKTALVYYDLCKKSGVANIEEDKQAESEAKEYKTWLIDLLKARLLYDGHYLDQSMDVLKKTDTKKLACNKFKLEYHYRKARVYQEQKLNAEAILEYLNVIDMGKKETYYYAAYSALQLGYIYTEKGNKELAKLYFNMAKDDFKENKEYVNSIEQKAKAALKKLGK